MLFITVTTKEQLNCGKTKRITTNTIFYSCDFTNSDDIHNAIENFFDQAKEPYAMVNLIGDPARVDWQKAQINHMQESFLKNASAPLTFRKRVRIALARKKYSGRDRFIFLNAGQYPFEGSLYYGTPKAALIHGAKILAKEFGGDPFVRVNVIAPGVNQAGMAEESIKKRKVSKTCGPENHPTLRKSSQHSERLRAFSWIRTYI